MKYFTLVLGIFILLMPFQKGIASTKNPIVNIYSKLKTFSLKNSFEIQRTKNAMEQASAGEHTQFTKTLPKVTATFSREFNPDERDIVGQDQTNLIVRLNYPIYDKRTSLRKEQAGEEYKLASNENELKTSEVDLRLRSLYGELLVEMVKINFFLKTIKTSTKNFEYIKKGQRIGRNSRLDVLRAHANVDLLVTQLNQQIQLKETSLEKLMTFTGMQSKEFHSLNFSSILNNNKNIMNMIDEFTNNLILNKRFLKLKKEYLSRKSGTIGKKISSQSLLYKKIITEEKLEIIRADNLMDGEWVDVDFRATYTKESDKISKLFGEESTDEFKVGIFIDIPLFSFGSLYSANKEKQMARAIARVNRKEGELGLQNSIKKDIRIIQNLHNNIGIQDKLVEQNGKIAKLSLISYKLKKSDLQDLINSDNNLLNSQAKLIEEKIRLSNSIRSLFFRLGELSTDE